MELAHSQRRIRPAKIETFLYGRTGGAWILNSDQGHPRCGSSLLTQSSVADGETLRYICILPTRFGGTRY